MIFTRDHDRENMLFYVTQDFPPEKVEAVMGALERLGEAWHWDAISVLNWYRLWLHPRIEFTEWYRKTLETEVFTMKKPEPIYHKYRKLTVREDNEIHRYIVAYANNIPFVDLSELPTWLREIDEKRRALDAILVIYRQLPFLARLYIPGDIRRVLDKFMEAKDGYKRD